MKSEPPTPPTVERGETVKRLAAIVAHSLDPFEDEPEASNVFMPATSVILERALVAFANGDDAWFRQTAKETGFDETQGEWLQSTGTVDADGQYTAAESPATTPQGTRLERARAFGEKHPRTASANEFAAAFADSEVLKALNDVVEEVDRLGPDPESRRPKGVRDSATIMLGDVLAILKRKGAG